MTYEKGNKVEVLRNYLIGWEAGEMVGRRANTHGEYYDVKLPDGYIAMMAAARVRPVS